MKRHAVDRLGAVPRTLLIPLVARADARRLWPGGGFVDPVAERVVARLEAEGVDLAEVRRDHPAARSLVLRAQWFDRECAAFFREHPDGTAASLGVGLDARHERLMALGVDAAIAWHEFDLPEVVAIRHAQLGACGARARAGDALSEDWLSTLPERPGCALLVVMEGLLMYLPRAGVDALFRRLLARQQRLGGSLRLLFDGVSRSLVRAGRRWPAWGIRHDALRAARLFQSGFSGQADLESIAPPLRVDACHDLLVARGGWMGWLLRLRARRHPHHPHYAAWRLRWP